MWARGSRGVLVGAGVVEGLGVTVGGTVSDGSGVHVGVLVIVGGRGVVVGIKAAMTCGPSSRSASHVAVRPTITNVAASQNRRVERLSRTA